MIAALGIGLLGMFMITAPPDISGQWTGDEWGQVVLKKTDDTDYTGTYTDIVGKPPGELHLKWSRIERRFNGTWREGEDRFGELSVRKVGDEIHGALTTDPKSKINPATPRLADLTWTRTKSVDKPVNENANGHSTEKLSSPNRIFFTGDIGLVSVDPDGKDERKLDVPENAKFWAVPSPDGLRVAYVVESANEKIGSYLCVAEIGGKAQASRFRFPAKAGYLDFSWSPDGTLIHACTGMEGVKGVQHYRLDVKGMTLRPLDMLKTRTVDGWAADGKSLVTTEVGDGDQWEPKSIHLVDLDGKEKQVLAAPKGWAAHGQLSPDGKRLLVCHEGGLAVVNVGKPETLTPVAGGPDENIERGEFDWSPDGKRIVFRRQKGTLQEPGDVELVVADPDGKNATVIRKSKADGIWKVYWR